MEYIEFLWCFFGVSAALLLWSIAYRFMHVREDVRFTQKLEDSNWKSSLGGTFNGCGASTFGGFQTKHPEGAEVYYIFLTIVFIPIMPVGCVLASKTGHSGAFMGVKTHYKVYGDVRMKLSEVISCYFPVWLAFTIGSGVAVMHFQ